MDDPLLGVWALIPYHFKMPDNTLRSSRESSCSMNVTGIESLAQRDELRCLYQKHVARKRLLLAAGVTTLAYC